MRQAAGVSSLDRIGTRWEPRSPLASRYALLRRLLACADLIAALLASVSLVILSESEVGQLAWSVVFLPAWIVIAKLLGLYDRDETTFRPLTVDEIPNVVLWALVGTFGLFALLGLTPVGRPDSSGAIIAGAVAASVALALRAFVRWGWRRATPTEQVAVIGSAGDADAFKRKLDLFPDLHMAVVEQWSFDGRAPDLAELAVIDRVVIAPESLDEVDVSEAVEVLRARGIPVSIVAPRGAVFGPAVHLDHIAELSILQYRKRDPARSTLLLKRALDVVLSAVALVLLVPLFAVVALAIVLDSGRPVFFSQRRAGQDGRPFTMRKFRTMVQEAEELLPSLVRLDELAEPVFKIEHDPRVTRVGRWLRRWSIDELPQLVNVLRGEMSLVGPRPEQVELVDQYTPAQRARLIVKPGLTGPMQVYGRGALDLGERIAVEEDYIENLSLGRDVRILAMTLSAVVRGEGAF